MNDVCSTFVRAEIGGRCSIVFMYLAASLKIQPFDISYQVDDLIRSAELQSEPCYDGLVEGQAKLNKFSTVVSRKSLWSYYS